MKTIPGIALCLTLAAVTFTVAAPAEAQVDWHQEFLNSSILSDDLTMIDMGGGIYYVAINDCPVKGIQDDGSLGNGSYVITGDGDATDCGEQPAECQQMLEEAADSAPAPTTKSRSPTGNDPETEKVLLTRFELQADGSIRYAPEGGLRGVNGVRLLDSWFAKRRIGQRRTGR